MSLDTQPRTSTRPHPKQVTVLAPCRLHFGLLRVGNGPRRFGGAGLMLSEPSLKLVAEPSESFRVAGELSERVEQFAQTWSGFHRLPLPPLKLNLTDSPPQHSGLGVGTQLGLAVAAVLHEWTRLEISDPANLARSVQRGLRSSVGAYGFHRGGFIVERGKAAHEWLAPLDLQVHVPADWRFLMIRPLSNEQSVFGSKEQKAFDALQADPELEQLLEATLRDELAPAAVQADYEAFADSVQKYGRLAGTCFAKFQGGPYNGRLLNELVAALQDAGAKGVGQSSWGPTLFACFPHPQAADDFANEIRGWRQFGPLEIACSAASQQGAKVTVVEQPT